MLKNSAPYVLFIVCVIIVSLSNLGFGSTINLAECLRIRAPVGREVRVASTSFGRGTRRDEKRLYLPARGILQRHLFFVGWRQERSYLEWEVICSYSFKYGTRSSRWFTIRNLS
jgi:hypothetical protein